MTDDAEIQRLVSVFQNAEWPLHKLAIMMHDERLDPLCQALVIGGADVNAHAPGWETPLHWALKGDYCNSRAVSVLVEHGANIHAESVDSFGRKVPSPIDYAAEVGMSDQFDKAVAEGQARRLEKATSSILNRDPRAMLAGMNRDQEPVIAKPRRL